MWVRQRACAPARPGRTTGCSPASARSARAAAAAAQSPGQARRAAPSDPPATRARAWPPARVLKVLVLRFLTANPKTLKPFLQGIGLLYAGAILKVRGREALQAAPSGGLLTWCARSQSGRHGACLQLPASLPHIAAQRAPHITESHTRAAGRPAAGWRAAAGTARARAATRRRAPQRPPPPPPPSPPPGPPRPPPSAPAHMATVE